MSTKLQFTRQYACEWFKITPVEITHRDDENGAELNCQFMDLIYHFHFNIFLQGGVFVLLIPNTFISEDLQKISHITNHLIFI